MLPAASIVSELTIEEGKGRTENYEPTHAGPPQPAPEPEPIPSEDDGPTLMIDPDGNVRRRFMEENPGPALYREVQKMDPGRPIIKGSFCEDDLLSGDSHNYLGSLCGGEYADIYEKISKYSYTYRNEKLIVGKAQRFCCQF